MLKLAGVKVAMDNAKAEVKFIADEVIADCDQDAIGAFVQRYL
jgi:hydroxymethylpyrimidine pyrophosphatase-like HAD family hydrolase